MSIFKVYFALFSIFAWTSILFATGTEKIENDKPQPIQALIERLGLDSPADIQFQIDPAREGFSIHCKDGGNVEICAGTQAELVPAYGYYLKQLRGAHWSWSGNRLAFSKPFPRGESLQRKSAWRWRYAYNYCTLSYTSAFWGKDLWIKEIDRLALYGVTHALVQAGLEKVWQLTLQELGYPDEKIEKFIPNPAFAAWWNMGNLEGHGGPLSQNLIEREAELGRFIVKQMQDLGIQPVLQGFVGLVPHDLSEHFSDAGTRYFPQGEWVDGFIRPAVLDPRCPAFQKLAKIWYKNLKRVYGIDACAFSGDLFHEGGTTVGIDIQAAATEVSNAMLRANPESVWLIQAWGQNPSPKLLAGIKPGKGIILNLCKNFTAGTLADYNSHGHFWLWCELSNFGGNAGLYGNLNLVGKLGKLLDKNKSLCGLGMMSEGTELNPFFYSFFFERFWEEPSRELPKEQIEKWIEGYVAQRYGEKSVPAENAWKILERSVYSPNRPQEGTTESILCANPAWNVTKASAWATGNVYWKQEDVANAFALLVEAGKENSKFCKEETYCWDLCDVGRQMLSDRARPLLAKIKIAYENKNLPEFERLSKQFLELIEDTEQLLASHPLWRFGKIYQNAKNKGETPQEKKNMIRAAKILVTRWGQKIGALNDYSHRQLSGLMQDYYRERWKIFFDLHREALEKKRPPQGIAAKLKALTMGFPEQEKEYSRNPEGDTFKIAEYLLKKYTQREES